jgi:hypothetical protein
VDTNKTIDSIAISVPAISAHRCECRNGRETEDGAQKMFENHNVWETGHRGLATVGPTYTGMSQVGGNLKRSGNGGQGTMSVEFRILLHDR